ncbi:protein kinase-like domain-containing protein [Artemisia annua]|uniref:Protein kinase-like domain-containing protein n=1 Tax=Artemisia annua TaxID=35608 RepID=A0A2U1N7L0_ARTAN|nr:protein kinase-like domain-containing protein [Artemisia annua]
MKPSFIHTTTILIIFSFYITLTIASSNDVVASLLAFKSLADQNNNLRYALNNTSSVCKWQGVQCDDNHNIVRLVLENLNLTGVFPPNTLTKLDQLRVLSLRNNSLTGPIPNLARLVNLKALFLDHNFFTGVIPLSISSLHRLRTLDLSHNKLSGVILVKLSYLDRLSYIRLDSNRFNGSIPPFNQSGLDIFNVSANFLTGPVPVTRALARFGSESFANNSKLCGEIVHTQCGTNISQGQSARIEDMKGISDSKWKRHKRIGLIVGFSICSFLVITLVLCVIMSIKLSKRKKQRKDVLTTLELMEMAEAADAAAEVMRMEKANELELKVRKANQDMEIKKSGNLVFCTDGSEVYTVDQLMRASAEFLGSGTIGSTYKAVVDNRVLVCVKRLDASRLGGMTNDEFERYMEVVGRVRHPNVVKLGAYFHAKEEKLLVYDYQANGSLFSLIHGTKSTRAKPLHWTSCLKIAEDVAQGLLYLHQSCNLVHGNLKSSNILLGSDFEARISDYSLVNLFHHNTDTHNEPTTTSDVYSYGVVLLELLTGKDASEHHDLIPDDLTKWVKSTRVNSNGTEEKQLDTMTGVAIECTIKLPEKRPNMLEVLKMLQEIKEVAIMEDGGLMT